MKPNKLMLIDGLHLEVVKKLKDFNEYLNGIITSLKKLDKLNLHTLRLYQAANMILEDPFVLFKFEEFAWPKNPEDIENISIPLKEDTSDQVKAIAFSFNSETFNEVIPPFKLYEISFFKRYKKSELFKNAYKLEVIKNINRSPSKEFKDFLEVIIETINEIISQEEDSGEKLRVLLTDISFSCIDVLHFPKEDRDRIFELVQNFLLASRSLNIIPISVSKFNGSPLINSIVMILEKFGNEIMLENLELLNDKLFLSGKLKIEERTPVLEYTNQIFDSPYLKEKCFLMYVRLDKDLIYRIELPSFALDHIDGIHSLLLTEYKLSQRKMKKRGLYSLNKTQANLITKKIKRNELIELINIMIKDEMTKYHKKRIGLIANML